MNIAVEIILAILLVVGAMFAFIGSWGLVKLDDFYMRLHAPTKASTLGLGGILTASAVYFTATGPVVSVHEIWITVFLFITAPVSAHMLAKTALHERFEYKQDEPNPLDHPMNVKTEQLFDITGRDDFSEEE